MVAGATAARRFLETIVPFAISGVTISRGTVRRIPSPCINALFITTTRKTENAKLGQSSPSFVFSCFRNFVLSW
jgi:hypothetical protein